MRTTLHKFDVPLLSVCWVWSDLIWHNCVDSHPGLYHKHPEVEHPGSADSLHSKLQVSQVSGTERYKNCVGLNEWPQRAPTDCLQWFTGATGVVYSYNHAGGQVGFKRHSRLKPLLVVLIGRRIQRIYPLCSSSSTRKTTRTASELRTGSVGSSGRRRVGPLTVSAR